MNPKIRLVITTDGREGLLDRALGSLDSHVRPHPAETVIVDDSGDRDYGYYLEALLDERLRTWGGSTTLHSHPKRRGFCETVAEAWALAGAESEHGEAPEFVLWLEDDFVFARAVPLVDIAFVLQMQEQVAQMLLCRQPVNAEERRNGGFLKDAGVERRGSGTSTWLEHRSFWSTNPSLFRREIAVEHPWPVIDHCEGIFTRNLLEARPETTFGVWGDGSPWVVHHGDRVGVGY